MNLNLSFNLSIVIFSVSIFLLWYFCSKLSSIVDFIDDKFKLGNAFGGTIILSVVTNLPETAIIISGAIKGNTDLAVGNILGGIVIQSALLILFDFANRKETKPLSTLTNSKTSILQGLFLVLMLSCVVVGTQLKPTVIFARVTPPELLMLFLWLISIFAMSKFQTPTKIENKTAKKTSSKLNKKSAVIWLIVISIVVLVFGVLLEATSDTIAKKMNIEGVIFGATVLALITSLPEISGGISFLKKRTYQPIISDIFGGNTFLPVLFLPATIITNKAILPKASPLNIYLATVAIIITTIYVIGMMLSRAKKFRRLGMDSWVALLIYLLSVIGMFFI
ncbi:cation:H+ antiporter [Pedobacter sp. UYP30]|uniref:sodium:calcium antiporter n=1 Tax=Pedobacter sp. UYP30 TaxID=1756400 RepID=UPI00339AD04F